MLIVTALAACGEQNIDASVQQSESTAKLICSYAPSQSDVVGNLASAAGGGAAAAAATAQAAGLSVVAHSSGAYIFTGSAGYIAGTLGTAIVAPVLVGVGVTIGGAAATVELLCAPQNHPDMVAEIKAAASDFYDSARGKN